MWNEKCRCVPPVWWHFTHFAQIHTKKANVSAAGTDKKRQSLSEMWHTVREVFSLVFRELLLLALQLVQAITGSRGLSLVFSALN